MTLFYFLISFLGSKGGIPQEIYDRDCQNDNDLGEMIFNARHNLSLWDYIFKIFVLIFCGFFALGSFCVGIERDEIGFGILIGIFFGLPCVESLYDLIYLRKNRFFVTDKGIGFERRHFFTMQRLFFYFGEVGFCENFPYFAYRKVTTATDIYMLFPLKTRVEKRWGGLQIKSDFKIEVPVLNALGAYISPKIYNKVSEKIYLKEYILEQTKKAVDLGDLDLQGVEVKCLYINNGLPYAIFGEVGKSQNKKCESSDNSKDLHKSYREQM